MNKQAIRKTSWFQAWFHTSHPQIILILLLATDILFCIINLLYELTPLFEDRLYSLAYDGGYSEMFQYIKITWIILLLPSVAGKTGEKAYWAWVPLFIYFLLDDSLQFHEDIGAYLASTFNFPSIFGLRPVDLGEVLVFGTFGLLLFIPITVAYLKGSDRFRLISRNFMMILLLLIFFGGVIDIVDMLPVFHVWYLNLMFGVVEDGGEMLAISLFLTYLFAVFFYPEQDTDLLTLLRRLKWPRKSA